MLLNKLTFNIFFIFAWLLAPIWLLAQPVNNLVKDVVMPSPNATAFGKYVDIPVSYHTGVPNISIPIHTIQEGPLTVPIGLSYHASGVKVGELASWVGLGWNLEAGGVVTRTVMNVPDERSDLKGYYSNGSSLTQTDFEDDPTLVKMVNGEWDTEPDLFTFNMPGYNGKFYSNGINSGDNRFVLTPRQDVRIKAIVEGTEFAGFEITGVDGTKYYFGKIEGSSALSKYEEQRVNNGAFVRSSWYLIRIETHDKKFYINYNYEAEYYSYRSLASSKEIGFSCSGNGVTLVNSQVVGFDGNNYQNGVIYPGKIGGGNYHPYQRSDINGQRLVSITCSSGTTRVDFVSTTIRDDLDPQANSGQAPATKLDRIEIQSGSNYRCKRFTLNHEYWTSANFTDLTDPKSENKRLKLNSVQESSCTTGEAAATIPPYEFVYEGNSSSLPNRLSKAVDHWGFYNGASVNENMLVNAPDNEITWNGAILTYDSDVNRNSNEEMMKLGNIREVIYPTGGKTIYQFEANKVASSSYQLIPFSKPGLVDGNRLLNSNYAEEIDINYSSTIPVCCYINENSVTFQLTQDEVDNGVFKMTLEYAQASGGTYCNALANPEARLRIDLYDVAANTYKGSFQIHTTSYTFTPNPIYLRQLVQSGSPLEANRLYEFRITVTQGAGVVFFFNRQSTVIDEHVGGLRIREIRTQKGFTAATDDIIKTYSYQKTDGNSSGKLLRKPVYGWYTKYYAGSTQLLFNATYFSFNGDSEVPLHSTEGYHLRYGRVTESNNGNGKSVFEFELEEPDIDNSYPAAPTKILLKDGKLKNMNVYRENSTVPEHTKVVTNEGLYQYSQTQMCKLLPLGVSCTIPGGFTFPLFAPTFYAHRTGNSRTVTVTESLDGVSTTTAYAYDPGNRFLAPTAITVTNSDGKAYNTEYTYPQDISGNAAVAEMVNRNMIANPVQVVKKHAGQILEGSRTGFSFYSLNEGIYTPDFVNSAANPIYPNTFERYEATWNAGGTLIKTDPNGDGWDLQGTILSYSASGLPRELRMNNWNDSEFFTWTNAGRIQQRQFKNFTSNYTYYSGTQLLQSITDLDGQITSFEYDGLTRLKKTTARGGAINTTYSYTYKDAANANLNHITTSTTFATVNSNSLLSSKTSREYFDGLGRLAQSIQVAHSPQGRDVISAVEYDNQGRISKEYTPYHSTTSAGQYVAIPGTYTHTLKQYFASPLNRLSTVTPPDWFASTYTYGANTAADNVWLNGSSSTNYAANLLSKTVITDPDGLKSITFTDKLGRTILARRESPSLETADTYTLYDDKNRVTTVIPPGATLNTPGLLFQYRYNGIDQITDKYVPDAGWSALKYNIRDLPAAIQDANNLALGRWVATNYDDYGRPIASGFVTSIPTSITNFTINDPLNTTTYDGTLAIERGKVKSTTSKILDGSGYLNITNTFDPYGRIANVFSNNILNLGNNAAELITRSYDNADNVLSEIRTHKKDGNTTNDIILYHNWTYDAKGRKSNYTLRVNNGATQTISNHQYTFRDEVSELNLGGTSSTALQSLDYTYNTQGWLTGINSGGIGTGAAAALSFPLPNPIFNPTLNSPNSATTVDNNDLFYFDIRYADPMSGYEIPAEQKKNGNISQIWYQVRGRNREGWGYTYDYLDRLKKAQHVLAGNTTSTGRIIGSYSEEVDYADARGNIGSIRRRGVWGANLQNYPSGVIDQLSFSYLAGTNKLHNIADAAPAEFAARGFNKKLLNQTYLYDGNGNISQDPRSGFKITYNHLNLPTLFEELNSSGTVVAGGKRISITYDASSAKLKKTTSGGATGENYTQYYLGGIEYRDGLPESIYHSEGRVYNTSSTSTPAWRYEYAIRDHLGNTRLMFADQGTTPDGVISSSEILQENHYYPFGMNMEGPWLNNVATRDSKYMYNGKELEDDFGLNIYAYGFRYLDPAINRFISVDPLALDFPELTTFQYASNRPVDGIDLDGLEYVDAQGRQLGPVNPQEYANKTGIIVMEAIGFEGVNKETDMYYPEISVTSDGRAFLTHGMISPVKDPGILSEAPIQRIHPVTGVVKPHLGADIISTTQSKNAPILAPTDGTIESVKPKEDKNAAGNRVHMKDKGGYRHSFFHLKDGVKVKEGDKVKKGDTIGIMGRTGVVTGIHLHYEIRDPNGTVLNPRHANPGLRNAPVIESSKKKGKKPRP